MKFFACTAALVVIGCSTPNTERLKTDEPAVAPNQAVMELEAQMHVGLQVAPVAEVQLNDYLQVTGTVQPVDGRISQVRPLARGRLVDVAVRVGDRVPKGQVLARYDNVEAVELTSTYTSAQAELDRLKVQLASIAKQSDRKKALAEAGAIAQKDYELVIAEQQGTEQSIRSQEAVIRGLAARLTRFGVSPGDVQGGLTASLGAPFAGVILKVNAAPGKVVEPSDELFTIADLSQVWVQAEVYAKDLGRIKVGQPATITVDTYPDESFLGRVTYIADFLDPQTRTARVRCDVPNPVARLKLDMFASVQLPTTFSRKAIAIPDGALQQVDGKSVVFVRKGPTSFEARPVKTGKTVSHQTEILDGLNPAEMIVVQGAFHLKSIMSGKNLGEE